MMPFALALLGMSCVISYGEPDLTAPISSQEMLAGADFTALDARLLLLMESNDDRDRDLRLMASRDLLKQARLWPRDAQDDLLAFMLIMLDVEERVGSAEILQLSVEATEAREMEVDGDKPLVQVEEIIEVPLTSPQEEELADAPAPPPEEADSAAPSQDEPVAPRSVGTRKRLASDIVVEAREALGQGRYEEALSLLESLGNHRRGPTAEGLWREAMNGYVHQERTRTGQLFLQARAMSAGPEKRALLEDVERALQDLLARYPESTYAGALQRNLVMVERELTKL